MSVPGDFSANQERALAALLSSGSLKGAAEKCGLNEKTIRRYLNDPDFKQAYRERRVWMSEQAIGGLQKLSSNAVAVAGELMKEEYTPATRLRAARTVLE